MRKTPLPQVVTHRVPSSPSAIAVISASWMSGILLMLFPEYRYTVLSVPIQSVWAVSSSRHLTETVSPSGKG